MQFGAVSADIVVMKSISESYADFVNSSANWLMPLSAMIELTDGCNLRCGHCYKTDHVSNVNELPVVGR
jgi:sulfatase maturation enzyme AslB (radical SAM superfamily)